MKRREFSYSATEPSAKKANMVENDSMVEKASTDEKASTVEKASMDKKANMLEEASMDEKASRVGKASEDEKTLFLTGMQFYLHSAALRKNSTRRYSTN